MKNFRHAVPGAFSTSGGEWHARWTEAGKHHKKHSGRGNLDGSRARQFWPAKQRRTPGRIEGDVDSVTMLCRIHLIEHLVEDTAANGDRD